MNTIGRAVLASAVALTLSTATHGHSHMSGGEQMQGHGKMNNMGQGPGQQGMMGGQGMKGGMMHGGMMGGGMMHGGMMGSGMMHGGMMGSHMMNMDADAYLQKQEWLDKTADKRRELWMLQFDLKEAQRTNQPRKEVAEIMRKIQQTQSAVEQSKP